MKEKKQYPTAPGAPLSRERGAGGEWEKNVPKLRFPGFEGEWEEKKGHQLFNSSREKGVEGLPIYSVTIDDGLVLRESLDRNFGNDAKPSDNLRIKPMDLAYNMMRMWQGAVGISYWDGMVSPAYIVLEPQKGTDSIFFYHFFKTKRKLYFLKSYSYGLTDDRLRLYFKDFSAIKFRVPSLPEQQKIAAFLTAIDTRIGQLSRKKALLEQYKKSVMQQLFSQKIRFRDEDGKEFPEWRREEFGSLAHKTKEQYDPLKSEESFICIELESLSQETGILLETYDSRDQRSIKTRFYKGDVLFGKLRPYLKKFLIAPFGGVCSSEIWVLRGDKVSNTFLYYLIQTQKFSRAANITSGSKMPRANWDFVSNTLFSYPSLPEQQKIADFLSAIDRKIAHTKIQLENTQTFKKGLLQQLFV